MLKQTEPTRAEEEWTKKSDDNNKDSKFMSANIKHKSRELILCRELSKEAKTN